MQYYKFEGDIEPILLLKGDEWNEWNCKHLYSTCAACGKEYLYIKSPILHNNIWNQVLTYYKILGDSKDIGKITRRTRLLFPIDNCTICKDCMEEALGRKLNVSDLKPQPRINRNLIKEGEI